MTAKEFAEMLNGREYGYETSKTEQSIAEESGLVIVYGYSDDCAEFEGAISEEVGCYDGGEICVGRNGIVSKPDCGDYSCKYYVNASKGVRTIKALWCAPNAEAPWTYETDIPHETFKIYEDGELYCIGLVFSMDDV